MQVESGLRMSAAAKWSGAGRVPPLDLSAVSVCPRETEHRWRHSGNNNDGGIQLMKCPSKKSLNIQEQRLGNDGLPFGEC